MPETADTQPVKMPLTSMDIVGEKRERLKQCLTDAFPEVMAEDKIDFDQLKRVLGNGWSLARSGLASIGRAKLLA